MAKRLMLDAVDLILEAVGGVPKNNVEKRRLADEVDEIRARYDVRVAADQTAKHGGRVDATRKWWRDLQRKTADLLEEWKRLPVGGKAIGVVTWSQPRTGIVDWIEPASLPAAEISSDRKQTITIEDSLTGEDVEHMLQQLHKSARKILAAPPSPKKPTEPYTRPRSPLGATIVDLSAVFDRCLGKQFAGVSQYSTDRNTYKRTGPRLRFIQACLNEMGLACSNEAIVKELRRPKQQRKKRRPR